jgi:hypothetical protein
MNATAKTRDSDSGIRQLPVAAIRLDPLAQPRAEVDHELATEYSEAMAAGGAFPPLVVFNDRRTYWLADGFHRHEAAKKAGLREIACVVKSGGLRDAILYSCQANSQHGWRRSNGDKRRAVLTLLADEEWGRWSDREVARRTKVSHELVRKLRAELTVNVDSENTTGTDIETAQRTYTTRHGTVANMDTARIGRNQEDHVERTSVRSGHPRAAAALSSVQSHAAALCSVDALAEDIVSACPDAEDLPALAEKCSRGAGLLLRVADLALAGAGRSRPQAAGSEKRAE